MWLFSIVPGDADIVQRNLERNSFGKEAAIHLKKSSLKIRNYRRKNLDELPRYFTLHVCRSVRQHEEPIIQLSWSDKAIRHKSRRQWLDCYGLHALTKLSPSILVHANILSSDSGYVWRRGA